MVVVFTTLIQHVEEMYFGQRMLITLGTCDFIIDYLKGPPALPSQGLGYSK